MQKWDFGPDMSATTTEFRLWAPWRDNVYLQIDGATGRRMAKSSDGWHRCEVEDTRPGSRYSFILDDGMAVPDPASRYQPNDVHGPSELIDLSAYRWRSDEWSGRPWEEIVLYELHIGAFTPEGTFLAAIDHLDHLKVLGVTAIQIMPVSDFPGRRGWGYDGVLPYAPDSSYGRPEDLQRLVDAAHERGICVFLDVVYNHFGPDGNYLPLYAPLFTEHHLTPWGSGINYDGESALEIREFIIQNALYWITEFRLDGLRLDAVHAIKDDGEEHLLMELARRVRSAADDRQVHLVVENENNDSDLLRRSETAQVIAYSAQWNDDIHHVLHVAATGEIFGYYADYAENRISKIGRALSEGFVFQGEHMPYKGEARGKPSTALPPTAFISFIQNHDQIGNRALGDRMIASRPLEAIKAVTAIYLLAPQIPMLFMGEEWGARQPFPYFCDFNEELNEKVRKGRREELSRLPGFDADDLPDPTAEASFLSAKLDWQRIGEADAEAVLTFYKTLLAIRKAHIRPILPELGSRGGRFSVGAEGGLTVEWQTRGQRHLRLLCNLSDHEIGTFTDDRQDKTIFALGTWSKGIAPAWGVSWQLS